MTEPPLPQQPPAAAPAPAPAPSKVDVPGWVYLCAGGVALLSVLVFGLVLVVANSLPGRPITRSAPAGSASPSPSESADPADSSSPSPEDSYRDPATMDAQSTDTTPFTEEQIFPEDTITSDDGTTYTLEAAGFFSACNDSGGADTAALMRAHGCGNMLTGDYANDTEGMFISTMVIPLTTTDDAAVVESDLDADGSQAFDELMVFCPHNAAYADAICHGSADPGWHATFTHYHRYLIIALSVLENGGDTPDNQHVRDAGGAVLDEVRNALDG